MNDTDSEIASFGPFQLSPTRRELERDGVALALGDRALDILIVLVERAGEIVSHKELIARVWRDLVVSPGNLRVHMTALRKALGDEAQNARYISNVAGQGYCFVAPVRRGNLAKAHAQNTQVERSSSPSRTALPPPLARMIGRDDAVATVSTDLVADRFVTIVGPGGMGKTTVAISVAHALLPEFDSKVCFVDVGAITDPRLLAATVASTLGLTVQTEDALPSLLEFLRGTRMLLVLDDCERLIDAAATLAELIFNEASQVYILATSREALRAEGEHAFMLPALSGPLPDSPVTAAQALGFPAVKLLIERAWASGRRFELSDADAPAVASICDRLDGIALAIEIAAARVATHGIQGTAELLRKRFELQWQGRRTARPRHQTLQALLDWSYGMLAESDRFVLQRLSIFVGTFTLDAARAVLGGAQLDETHVAGLLEALVAKSLVSAIPADDGVTRYRLLQTTRDYALEKLNQSGNVLVTSRRHAEYFAALLDSLHGGRIDPSYDKRALAQHLGNVRAALEWCFGEQATADPALQADLAAAAAPVFLELSLLGECYRWTSEALAALDDSRRGTRREMILQEAWATSSVWIRGNSDDVRSGITRAMDLAQQLGEPLHRLRLLVGLHVFLIRLADFRAALAIVDEWSSASRKTEDVSSLVMSDLMQGMCRHFLGDQAIAQRQIEAGFARVGNLSLELFGLDHRVRALIVFARTLWLRGYPDRAMQTAREAVAHAMQSARPVNACFALIYTAPVFLWCGEWQGAQETIARLTNHTHWHILTPFHSTGRALQGLLNLALGEPEHGTSLLQGALETMRHERQNVLVTYVACGLAEGLRTVGRGTEALTVVHAALADAKSGGEGVQLPELLRIEGVLLSESKSSDAQAEERFMRSLAQAREGSALSWELRTSLSLARLRVRQGRLGDARDLVRAAYGRFTEGFATEDLKAARRFLNELN